MADQIKQNITFRVKRHFLFKPPRYYCSACGSSFLKDTIRCPRCDAYFYKTYYEPMTITEEEINKKYFQRE